MAEIPTPRSLPEIIGTMLSSFTSRFGLRNIKPGSPVLSLFETAAQSDFRSTQDIFTLLNAQSLDRAEGASLDAIGADEEVPRITQSPSSGLVNVSDSSFTKVVTKIFQGSSAPIVGTTSINVEDASSFTATGNLYLGRGTGNFEGPIPYASTTNNGTFWTIVLSSPTLKFHNTGETVVFAQGGNRIIGSGSIVQTPQGSTASSVQFSVVYTAVLPDGETSVSSVLVVAQKPGTVGNVGTGAINSFASPPFSGATVTNPIPYSNGLDTESDSSYRERIRAARQSRSKGTAISILTNSTGVFALDENKRVLSSSLVTDNDGSSILYIDDGTGYEEISEGIAIESIVDIAFGGEQYFTLTTSKPIAKAFIATSNTTPFALSSGDKLAVRVGGVYYEHTFDASQFSLISNANTFEIISSINSNPALGFAARSSQSGTIVNIFAKSNTNEDIEVVTPSGNDANQALSFPSGRFDTLKLYKNDQLLFKDGRSASIFGNFFSNWGLFSGNQTLTISVDGTPVTTYTFTDQDFIDANTGYSTVGNNSLNAWVAVLNYKVPGITATSTGNLISLVSNLGALSRASIVISGGTIITNGIFSISDGRGESFGINKDYTLNRSTGQIKLEVPLSIGDRLAVGSINTRAFIESPSISAVTLATAGKVWFSVDGDASIIDTGLSQLNITINSAKEWGYRMRVASATSSPIFANAQVGDWLVIWDSAINTSLRGTWRVADSTSTYIEIDRRSNVAGRSRHQMTTLADGRVLVTGGLIAYGDDIATNSCEIYDPTAKTWTPVAHMSINRIDHTATLLSTAPHSGKVLVAGGRTQNTGGILVPVATAELYDPIANTWTSTGSLATARYAHTSTKLTAGDVLSVGGIDGSGTYLATTEIFSVAGGTWSGAGSLATARARHTANIITGGDVVIVGGEDGTSTLASCERYTGVWGVTGSMATARQAHASVFLTSAGGIIVATGGSSARDALAPVSLSSCETYSIGPGTWAVGPASMVARSYHVAVKINTVDLIVYGGFGPTIGNMTQRSLGGTGAFTTRADSLYPSFGTTSRVRAAATQLTATTSQMLVCGGQTGVTVGSEHIASSEIYDNSPNAWSRPDPATISPVTLASSGLSVIRSSDYIQPLTIASGANYTAPTFVSSINSSLKGAASSVYKTTQLRVGTNTFDVNGDIALVAADLEGQKTLLPISNAINNITGHIGSVESGNSDIGTPHFGIYYTHGSNSNLQPIVDISRHQVPSFDKFNGDTLDLGLNLVGLKARHDLSVFSITSATRAANFTTLTLAATDHGYLVGDSVVVSSNNTNFTSGTKVITSRTATTIVYSETAGAIGPITNIGVVYVDQKRYGNNTQYTSSITALSANDFDITARESVYQNWVPNDRVNFNNPYRIGPNDNLVVLTNNDEETGRFNINMFRKLKPSNATYGAQNTYKDADNSNLTLTNGFGLTFDFNDYAIHMKARTKSHPADATKTILYRYFRHGAEGNTARLRYTLPSAADQPVQVTSDIETDQYTNISISLASGVAKSPGSISADHKIGTVCTAKVNGIASVKYLYGFGIDSASGFNGPSTTVLTLSPFPAGITDHGFLIGDNIYVFSTNINYATGLYTITARTATTITYTEAHGVDVGPDANIGTVSFGPFAAAHSGLLVGDLFRLGSTSSVPSDFTNKTMRISALPDTQTIEGVLDDFAPAPSSVVVWSPLADFFSLSIFTNSNQTTSAIAIAVNALFNGGDSICPISATLIGTGLGTIDQSSTEEAADSTFYYNLTDGINYVKSTVLPILITDDYDLVFKHNTTASLATGSDWTNEDVRIVPTTVKGMVNWLNAPTVSGLFTACSIQSSTQNKYVQLSTLTPGSLGAIEVQGGLANSTTAAIVGSAGTVTAGGSDYGFASILETQSVGLTGNSWVSVDNTNKMPKTIITSNTKLEGVTSDGYFTFETSGDKVWNFSTTSFGILQNIKMEVEKQGKFIAFTSYDLASLLSFSSIIEGRWVKISNCITPTSFNQLDSVNTGTFRVVRVLHPDTLNEDTTPGTFWIENPNATEEGPAECDLQFLQFDSVMPGDTLKISTDLWNSDNKGSWTVQSVGSTRSVSTIGNMNRPVFTTTVEVTTSTPHGLAIGDYFTVSPGEPNFSAGTKKVTAVTSPTLFKYLEDGPLTVPSITNEEIVGLPFQNNYVFKVSTDTKNTALVGTPPGALGSQSGLVQVIEQNPSRVIKQVYGISQNPNNDTLVDLKFTSDVGYTLISEAAGSIVSVLDKLNFPLTSSNGTDGYRHNIGLIGAVNQVLQGDPDDSSTYPGVVSAGATINISGPLVKRIKVSLQIRARTGIPKLDIETNVKSSVATVINKTPVGESVSLSDIVSAANKVNGVIGVAIISPLYNTSNDLISVQPFEKALALDLDTDILVSFL